MEILTIFTDIGIHYLVATFSTDKLAEVATVAQRMSLQREELFFFQVKVFWKKGYLPTASCIRGSRSGRYANIDSMLGGLSRGYDKLTFYHSLLIDHSATTCTNVFTSMRARKSTGRTLIRLSRLCINRRRFCSPRRFWLGRRRTWWGVRRFGSARRNRGCRADISENFLQDLRDARVRVGQGF